MKQKQSYQEPAFEISAFETLDVVMSSLKDNGDGTFDNVGHLPGGWIEV